MMGNDISNNNPTRFLVNLSFIRNEEQVTSVRRRLFRSVTETSTEYTMDRFVLNKLWQLKDRVACILELFSTTLSVKEMANVENTLDTYYVNPFNYVMSIKSQAELLRDLPYRPDVYGVIDAPETAMIYGSKYFDMARVGL